jgi:hypothetical protein
MVNFSTTESRIFPTFLLDLLTPCYAPIFPLVGSDADPGCLYRIPDPDNYPSRIPDPTTASKEEGKTNLLSFRFCTGSQKYHKIGNYFIFEEEVKKISRPFHKET